MALYIIINVPIAIAYGLIDEINLKHLRCTAYYIKIVLYVFLLKKIGPFWWVFIEAC